MTLTTAQLALRKQGIGASEVAAVLGLDSRRTPFDVWYAKTQEPDTPAPPPATDGPVYWGHVLEPVIAQEYAKRLTHPVALSEPGTIVGSEPWMLATPDRVVSRLDLEATWLLEIKSRTRGSMFAQGWGAVNTDEVPDTVLAQVMWQMGICGYDRCDVAAFLGDDRTLLTFRVPFSAELFTSLVEQVGEWWQRHVVGQQPPEIHGQTAAAYVRQRFPNARDAAREATAEELPLLQEYADAKALAKSAEEALERLTPAVQLAIGPAKGIIAPGIGRITWGDVKGRTTTDWEAIARARGASEEDIIAHTRIAPGYRQMRFTPAKG